MSKKLCYSAPNINMSPYVTKSVTLYIRNMIIEDDQVDDEIQVSL